MVMGAKKSRILVAIILVICSYSWCMGDALEAGKAKYEKRQIKAVQDGQVQRIAGKPNAISIYKQLAKTVDLSTLSLHTPFSQAIDILRNSAEPPLNIVVLWRDLSENALIEQDTPISMQGVSGIRLRTGLELLLRAVSSIQGELGYVIDGGVIIIATKDSLPIKKVTRIYDIRDLTAPPANYRFAPPVGPFGVGAFGLGQGLLAQRPIGGLGRAFGIYGRAARPNRREALPYGSGRPRRGADEVANLLTRTIAPRSWR